MSKPLIVSIPHGLGQEEATRRIKDGLRLAREKYGSLVSISQEDWADDQLSLSVGALGQHAHATIRVTESDATVSIALPWLLARFAEKAQSVLQQQGQLLLQKK